MTKNRQTVHSSSDREFATFPVALLAFVLNRREEFLLLKRAGESSWEIPSGALESGESPIRGLTRELHEELGDAVRYRVLGPVHATSLRLDSKIDNLLSLGFAVQYVDGAICPGDDMAGASHQWISADKVTHQTDIEVPSDANLFVEALQIFRLKSKLTAQPTESAQES